MAGSDLGWTDANMPTDGGVEPDCPVPWEEFVAVDVGVRGCGVRPDGKVVCWPEFEDGPEVNGCFQDVAVGFDFACGLRTDGRIHCWGESDTYGQLQPPTN